MKRIAIVTGGNTDDRKGFLNATIERIKYLSKYSSYEIDVIIIQEYEGWLVRKLRKTAKRNRPKEVVIDGIRFSNVWFKFTIIDYIFLSKLHKREVVKPHFLKKVAKMLASYDLISFQSYSPLVKYVSMMYNKPFTITWHGSDIHSHPFNSKMVFEDTKSAIEGASANFFVSKGLLLTSNRITEKGCKILSYNGVDTNRFKVLSNLEKSECRNRFGISKECINIAFCGNLFEVKNVLSLPAVFSHIHQELPSARFFIAGSGKLKSKMEQGFSELNVPVTFVGNLKPDEMPSFLNVVDLVVLPSKNEGLPLISVEALSCGAKCVAAMVGGIPEILSEHFCVEHGKDFDIRFAKTCLSALKQEKPSVPSFISWDETGRLEAQTYLNILENKDFSPIKLT